ncbi:MAG: TRIC cation channel family protein [Burkholderiales bacterium]|nr:TRIC cation channel family protein [Burkholderiales bacterium]
MDVLKVLDLVGVAVFAASGVLAVGGRGLDLFGVFVVAAATAVGGGTLRDVLLDRHPIFWIADPVYVAVIVAATAGTLVWLRFRPFGGRVFLAADALGLALFALTGARIAEDAAVSPAAVVILGTISGVAGGVLRDALSGEVPLILRRDIYATAAIAGIVLYLVAAAAGLDRGLSFALGMATVFALRWWAIVRGVALPTFRGPPA